MLLLAPWLLREPVRRRDLVYVMAVAAGMALFFLGTEQARATAPDPSRGNLIAAGSGLAWALTVTGLRWLGRSGEGNSAMATVAAGNLMAFLVALPMAVPVTAAAGGANLLVILYLGVVQIGLAYVCVTRAIRHVPAFEATTILLLEPVMNPIWAWLVHGEKPGPWALAGGAIILSATLVNTLALESKHAAVGRRALP
jgi:DME family drug/metabolite transporter